MGRQLGHKHVPASLGQGVAAAPHGFKGKPLPPAEDAASVAAAAASAAAPPREDVGSLWEVPGIVDPESGQVRYLIILFIREYD